MENLEAILEGITEGKYAITRLGRPQESPFGVRAGYVAGDWVFSVTMFSHRLIKIDYAFPKENPEAMISPQTLLDERFAPNTWAKLERILAQKL